MGCYISYCLPVAHYARPADAYAAGRYVGTESADFYSYMTLHGLGMAGVLFSMAFAALWYLNGTRYVRLNINLGYFLYGLTLLGVVGLTIGTLIGKFGAGWYMLYPLPFIGTTWPEWATGLSIISLIVLGVAWLIGCFARCVRTCKGIRWIC